MNFQHLTPDTLSQVVEKLKTRLNIAVLYASDKKEDDAVINVVNNTRPWKSYQAVAVNIHDALCALGFKNVFLLKEGIGLFDQLKAHNIHIVWLNTAGVQGYNPTAHAPSLLEMAGIPYIGHNPLLSTILDNKHCFKRELISYGIPTARYMVWDMTRGSLKPDINFRFQSNFKDFTGPFVVKPVSGRASLGVEVVESVEDLSAAVERVYQLTHNHILIEEYLGGKEYCVSVCGNTVVKEGSIHYLDNPFVFSEIERSFEKGEKIFTSMDVRPIDSTRAFLLNPQSHQEVIHLLHAIAAQLFRDFDIQTLIRIDLRADSNNQLRVLEANPKPDLKRFEQGTTSLVAMGLAAHHMSYEDLIATLLVARLKYLLINRTRNIAHITSLL